MNTYALDELIHNKMEQTRVPGVAIGIIHGDARYTQGYGVTNLRHPLPVDARTLFQICSISKTYLGTLVMMLVEEGRLELDAKIRSYLPDFQVVDKAASEEATIRMLLQHRAGWIGDWFISPQRTGEGEDALARYLETMRETPQLTPVGSSPFSYNNAGFNVAARIIEVVTGKPYERAIQERIFDPLGLKHSYFLPTDFLTHRFVSGHFPTKDGVRVTERWGFGRPFSGAGGITSCIDDVLQYARFHLSGGSTATGERLISEAGIRQLHEVEHYQSEDHGIGLTFWGTRIGDLWQYGHGCGGVGQSSLFFLIPEHDFAMMIATNSGDGSQVIAQARAWALAELLGIAALPTENLQLSEEQLREYTGDYALLTSTARVTSEDGALNISIRTTGTYPDADVFPLPSDDWSPPLKLHFIRADIALIQPPQEEFAIPHYGGFDFIFQRDQDGNIYALQGGPRLFMRQKTVAAGGDETV